MSAAPVEAVLDGETARRLTDQIKIALEGTWQLALRAWHGRAWVALGYAGWDEYCQAEFATSRLRLPRVEREEVVPSLAEAGMSTRAIAAVTGSSHATVARTLTNHRRTASTVPAPRRVESGRSGDTDDGASSAVTEGRPFRSTGRDGKTYPAQAASRSDVLLRRARAAALRRDGMSQTRIAATLGVAQATISTDLAQVTRLSQATGVAVTSERLAEVMDEDGRADVGALGRLLGVEVTPVRDLAAMTTQPVADVEATLAVLLDRVVLADEWLNAEQRRRAIAVLLPALGRSLALVARILGACHQGDADPQLWRRLATEATALAKAAAHTTGAAR